MPPPSALAQATAPSVGGLHDEARTLFAEAQALADQQPASAAAKYAAAAGVDARALDLEGETDRTWEPRHVIFCHAMAAWTRAFELGLRSRADTELAIATAKAYDAGLSGYADRERREPDCKANDLLLRATELADTLPPLASAAAQPTGASASGKPELVDLLPVPKMTPLRAEATHSRPRTVTEHRPVPRWQLGLLPTLGTLAVVGASVALGLGAAIHRGKTRESSGYLYRDVYDAIAASGATVWAGDSLCTPTTRADPTVEDRCRSAINARNGMIASAVIGGLAVVGTGVLAGLIARHRRGERHSSVPGVSVVWQGSGVTARLQVRF